MLVPWHTRQAAASPLSCYSRCCKATATGLLLLLLCCSAVQATQRQGFKAFLFCSAEHWVGGRATKLDYEHQRHIVI